MTRLIFKKLFAKMSDEYTTFYIDDEINFSYNIPYTYSKLLLNIKNIVLEQQKNN